MIMMVVNPNYARGWFINGREDTVSTRDLAPYGHDKHQTMPITHDIQPLQTEAGNGPAVAWECCEVDQNHLIPVVTATSNSPTVDSPKCVPLRRSTRIRKQFERLNL